MQDMTKRQRHSYGWMIGPPLLHYALLVPPTCIGHRQVVCVIDRLLHHAIRQLMTCNSSSIVTARSFSAIGADKPYKHHRTNYPMVDDLQLD
jgi:hypothetical protein